MFNDLCDVLVSIKKKANKIETSMNTLGFYTQDYYFADLMKPIEILILKSLGGSEEQYDMVIEKGNDPFYHYVEGNSTKEELRTTLQKALAR